MPENSFIMIHNPSGGGFGESSFLRSIADWLDKIRDTIAETYAKHCGGDIERIKSAMDAETWYTAKEASELFDNVELTESNDVKAVAQAMRSDGIDATCKYKSAPEALVATEEAVNLFTTEEDAEEATEQVVDNNIDIKNQILSVLRGAYNYEEKG